jgi:transposase
MDNAAIHKISPVAKICNQFGCLLKFLSPYSYMLNPVECIFSKVKNYVKSQLIISDKMEYLLEMIRRGITTVSKKDLERYFEYTLDNTYLAIDDFEFY